MTKLDRLRDLMEKATPGAWREGIRYAGITSFDGDDVVYVALADPHNRALIIALHNNAEALLRAVEQAKLMRDRFIARYVRTKKEGVWYELPKEIVAFEATLKELEEGT